MHVVEMDDEELYVPDDVQARIGKKLRVNETSE
jgi:hypothetical protein